MSWYNFWKKKEEIIDETFIEFRLCDNEYIIESFCEEGQEKNFANLLYLISSGVMLETIVENLKAGCAGENSKSYDIIIKELYELYLQDMEEKQKEELNDLNRPVIMPSEVFNSNEKSGSE